MDCVPLVLRLWVFGLGTDIYTRTKNIKYTIYWSRFLPQFSKVLDIVTLYSTFSRALDFEKKFPTFSPTAIHTHTHTHTQQCVCVCVCVCDMCVCVCVHIHTHTHTHIHIHI